MPRCSGWLIHPLLCRSSTGDVWAAGTSQPFEVVEVKKKEKDKKYKNSGTVRVLSACVQKRYTLVRYVVAATVLLLMRVVA